MVKRGQVLVRAKANGDYVTADILDLEQDSFNAFMVGALMKLGAVHGTKETEREEVQYVVRKELWGKYK